MPEDVYWSRYSQRFRTYPKLIETPCAEGTALIVCIPVLAEANLIATVTSLWESRSSDHKVEVILLFNTNTFMTADELHLHNQIWNLTQRWCKDHNESNLQFFPVNIEKMPDERGGVGWARKLGMDEASRRLKPEGIIACLDGDCKVERNYIKAIIQGFENTMVNAASIYFEHQYDHLSHIEWEAIILYELHLRYLVQAQKWSGHPYAYHTVGSSMAVRRNAYLEQGGMNTRRAGEDFYFLQKFIETDRFATINNTTVYPSARVSNRVPFGTGRAMEQMLIKGMPIETTNFESFRLIREFFNRLDNLQNQINDNTSLVDLYSLIPDKGHVFIEFLEKINFVEKLKEIRKHTTSNTSFRKRFFRFFNAFQMIRYMHFMRDHAFPDTNVTDAVSQFLYAMDIRPSSNDAAAYLTILRQLDRQNA